MTEYISGFLKNLGCSHCQEFEFQDVQNKDNLKNWKLYLKEFEMYSAMYLYNNKIKKDISYIINKNDSIYLINEKNEIFLKLEYILNDTKNNSSILVPTDDYLEHYEKIEQMEKIYDKEMEGYYIGTFSLKKTNY
jgi:hypothetical protein